MARKKAPVKQLTQEELAKAEEERLAGVRERLAIMEANAHDPGGSSENGYFGDDIFINKF